MITKPFLIKADYKGTPNNCASNHAIFECMVCGAERVYCYNTPEHKSALLKCEGECSRLSSNSEWTFHKFIRVGRLAQPGIGKENAEISRNT